MSTPEHILRCGRLPLFVDADLGGASPAEARAGPSTAALDRFAAEHRAAFARHAPAAEMLDPVPRVVAAARRWAW